MASKESLTVLVQLQILLKKEAHLLQKSLILFMAAKEFIDDPKLQKAEEMVKELFNKDPKKEEGNMDDIANKLITYHKKQVIKFA